jgi:hypothetical protein
MAFSLVSGDLQPPMQIQLEAPAAIAALATAQSVQMLWLRPDGTEVTVPLSIVNPTTGIVQYTWQSGDGSAQVGEHAYQVVVTTASGQTTDPNDGTSASFWVYARLSGTTPVQPTPPVVAGSACQAQLTSVGAVIAGAPVYISGNGVFSLAEANTLGTAGVFGLASAAFTPSQIGYITVLGPLTLLTTQWDAIVVGESGGLTPNAYYYLSDSIVGMLTTTAPTTPGHYSTLVGRAASTTTMLVTPQPPIFL